MLQFLAQKRVENPGQFSRCGIMLDGMSIRKQVDWDEKRKKMVGFVDLGTGEVQNDAAEATEALVVMAVGLQAHWKIPIAYFLINGMTAEVLSQCVLSIVSSLHEEANILAKTLTMDGHATNQKLVAILGGKLKATGCHPVFKHPEVDEDIFIFFDACHLLKNVRGVLHSTDLSTSAGSARWQDICSLQELQEASGLRAANKLTKSHICFENKKMKVKLAAQTLSNSVASALEYAEYLQCPNLTNCEGTIVFVRTIDRLFDIFNSRSPLAKGFKSPLNVRNWSDIESFLKRTKIIFWQSVIARGRKLLRGIGGWVSWVLFST